MSGYYILKNRIPVPVDDVLVWAKDFERNTRRVKCTSIPVLKNRSRLIKKTCLKRSSKPNKTKLSLRRNRKIKRKRLADEFSVVSTVFLGIDHGYLERKPLLFETMIFGGAHDQYQERCSTWEEAELMHVIAIYLVRKNICLNFDGSVVH